MKNTYYFSHDYNARNDDKIKQLIRKHRFEGYGIYWALVEDLYNNANAMRLDCEGIADEMRTESNVIKSIINDFGLFKINGENFSSESVKRRLNERNEKSNKARESANQRWNNTNAKRTHNTQQSDCNAIKERKEKKRKIDTQKGNDDYFLNELGWKNDSDTFQAIKKRFSKLLQMRVPLSYEQHIALIKKWTNPKVENIYSDMQNYSKLLSNNDEAAKTASSWLRRNAEKVNK